MAADGLYCVSSTSALMPEHNVLQISFAINCVWASVSRAEVDLRAS